MTKKDLKFFQQAIEKEKRKQEQYKRVNSVNDIIQYNKISSIISELEEIIKEN